VFSQKRHKGMLAKSATAVAIASVLSVAAAHASDVASSPMVLTAYENAAGGESVLKGQYDAALKDIKRDRSMGSTAYSAKQTNLCVTYAVMKQIADAKIVCDAAVKSARYDRLSSQRYSPGTVRENAYVAIAYTNRAVVHILAKDMESAKSDLARAKALAPTAEFVSKNLAAVQNSGSKIAQLDVAPSR
jgi:hypothetical protein